MNNPLPVSLKNIVITILLFLVFSLGCTLLAGEIVENDLIVPENHEKIIKMQQEEIELSEAGNSRNQVNEKCSVCIIFR
jgi:hypothetical protein